MGTTKTFNDLTVGRSTIFEHLDAQEIGVHYQPIYSATDGAVYGYEALSRFEKGNGIDIAALFKYAKREGLVSSLDVKCRENAIMKASMLGLTRNGAFLFLNVCPETLMDPAHRVGITGELAEEYGIPKENIILEITEESVIENYDLFNQTISHYRDQGYKIAIDDFGAGYCGLKMLSIIEPDFVKIDRHFVHGIDRSAIKLNLVTLIATVCRTLGIKVVVEGVETKEECGRVLVIGADLLQGYYLHKPAPDPSPAHALFPADVSDISRANCNGPHLSFPQATRIGNPSEQQERFRTGRNDKIEAEGLSTYQEVNR